MRSSAGEGGRDINSRSSSSSLSFFACCFNSDWAVVRTVGIEAAAVAVPPLESDLVAQAGKELLESGTALLCTHTGLSLCVPPGHTCAVVCVRAVVRVRWCVRWCVCVCEFVRR